ncbi:MAG: hypothetical protein ACTS10_21280 [Kiloniellales bacterium]
MQVSPYLEKPARSFERAVRERLAGRVRDGALQDEAMTTLRSGEQASQMPRGVSGRHAGKRALEALALAVQAHPDMAAKIFRNAIRDHPELVKVADPAFLHRDQWR